MTETRACHGEEVLAFGTLPNRVAHPAERDRRYGEAVIIGKLCGDGTTFKTSHIWQRPIQ